MLRPHLARMPEPELAELVRGAPELARLLPEIHDRLPDLSGLPPVGEPETRRRQMFGAVVAVVRRLAADGPVLMIVDDLHWADRSSLLLARHLAKEPRLGAVLMVGTFRDSELQPGHPLPELLAELERGRELPRVRLDGMDEREVAQLIGGGAEPGTVAAFTRRPAATRSSSSSSHATWRSSTARRSPMRACPGVRDVIAARVGRLAEHAGRVLGVAALIGRDFDLELLEGVAGLPEDDLLDVLDAAVRGALLSEVPSTPGRYSFAHALLRTTLEAELSATRQARLHLRIGEAIEQIHGDRLDPWLEELARHFGASGPQAADRAVAYAVRAAEQASARLAYEEAARLLDDAVAVRRRDEHADQAELARLENALAAAQADGGQWEAARASFVRAAVVARTAGVPAAFARAALGHAGGTWEQYGVQDTENVALLEEALHLLPAEDSAMRAQVLARIAVHRSFLAQVPEAEVRAIADERSRWRAASARPSRGGALTGALHARWRPGRAADRLELAAELIELTEAHAAITCAADAHIWRSGALLELGRLDEADVHLARHAELAETSQQPALLIHRDGVRSMRAALEGDYARGARIARERFERRECQEADGRLLTPIHAQFHGTNLLSFLNERGELGPHAPLFERLASQIAPPGWRPALAWAHVQGGRPQLSRELIEAMSRTASRRPRATATSSRASRRSRTSSPSSATRSSPRGSSRCWRPTTTSGSCSVRARARSAPSPIASGRCDCCWTGPPRRRSRSNGRSSARERCARGPTWRARRPGSPPRCAASARTPAPRIWRSRPQPPRRSSAWCACSGSSGCSARRDGADPALWAVGGGARRGAGRAPSAGSARAAGGGGAGGQPGAAGLA